LHLSGAGPEFASLEALPWKIGSAWQGGDSRTVWTSMVSLKVSKVDTGFVLAVSSQSVELLGILNSFDL
jgi:hypothetical protein